MYAITSGDTNFLKTHHVFDQSLVLTPKGQHWLGKARQFGHQLRCVCTGKASSPLHTRASVGGIQHPYRPNGTRREHHPLCIHGESSRSTLESYGAPSGSIVANGGRIAVNFDLLMPDDEQSADDCGEWQASHSDHGAALRSLMWLLLDQSGLNYSSPERRSRDPWRALLDGASGVDVTRRGKGGTLADLVLTPVVATRNWQAKRNYSKLCDAAKTTKRVLFACLLPAPRRDEDGREIADVSSAIDLRVNLHHGLLARARGQSPFAWERHINQREVLAFGCASAKNPKGESASARVNQLVLMPVGQSLMPLPKQEQVDGFAKSLETDTVFGVEPADDPMIAMRVGQLNGRKSTGPVAASRELRS